MNFKKDEYLTLGNKNENDDTNINDSLLNSNQKQHHQNDQTIQNNYINHKLIDEVNDSVNNDKETNADSKLNSKNKSDIQNQMNNMTHNNSKLTFD